MKTLVITKSGETVEVVNGVLSCKNTPQNWAVIADWSTAWEELEVMQIRIDGDKLFVEFTSNWVKRTLSLLEHFEYQHMVVDSLIKPEFQKQD